jgi:cytochrome c oxidase assembly protein subunit 20
MGAVVGFEYCQYLRRLERASMKRIVEVHTAATREKADRKAKEDQEKKRLEEEAAKRRGWKFW